MGVVSLWSMAGFRLRATSGTDYRRASSYDTLHVGMMYGSGAVCEIYPAIDKVTIAMRHGEIQHLKLSRVIQKIKQQIEVDVQKPKASKHSSFDTMIRKPFVLDK